jgi:hypothetical protein
MHHTRVADLGQVFHARVAAALDRCRHEFGAVAAREQHPGGAHGATESVFLRAPPWPLGPHSQNDQRVVNWPALQADPSLLGTLSALEQVTGLWMARAMFVRLAPGGVIADHTDEGAYADRTVRFHYPVETGPAALSHIDGETLHMDRGAVWGFEHRRPHRAINGEATPRVHLIFDGWLP